MIVSVDLDKPESSPQWAPEVESTNDGLLKTFTGASTALDDRHASLTIQGPGFYGEYILPFTPSFQQSKSWSGGNNPGFVETIVATISPLQEASGSKPAT